MHEAHYLTCSAPAGLYFIDKKEHALFIAEFTESLHEFHSSRMNSAFTLYGFNAEGQGELTVWADVDMVKGYSLVYMLCYCWDRIQPFVEEGHPFSIAVSRVSGDSLVIRDAETAAAIVSQLEEAGFAAPPTEE